MAPMPEQRVPLRSITYSLPVRRRRAAANANSRRTFAALISATIELSRGGIRLFLRSAKRHAERAIAFALHLRCSGHYLGASRERAREIMIIEIEQAVYG